MDAFVYMLSSDANVYLFFKYQFYSQTLLGG